MKPRVQIDTFLMVTAIVVTALLYFFPRIYLFNDFVKNVLEFLGYILILKGTMTRMSARGHKKAFSKKSHSLVTTGPYKIVRNPMYLGSFLIGAGFVFILWPWWGVPIFVWLFYTRFKRQIYLEEEMLSRAFGSKYTSYRHLTPRLFPTVHSMMNVRTKDVFNVEEAFSTKEKFGLMAWPAMALTLKYIQELLLFKHVDLQNIIIICLAALLTFAVVFIVMYLVK
jgi:protein-S-isoprenylcysteine O-methyltransferase Ste14